MKSTIPLQVKDKKYTAMKNIATWFLILISLNCFGQELTTMYLKSNGKPAKKEGNAEYILEIEKSTNKYHSRKYLKKNKRLLAESELLSYDPYIEDGISIYYEDKPGIFLAKGYYSKGELTGEWIYRTNKGYDTVSYCNLRTDPQTRKDIYLIVEEMPFFGYSSKLISEREILDNELKKLYSLKSDLRNDKDYLGILRKIEHINRTAFELYLQENLHYPVRAKESGIKGIVFGSFVINENGEIADVSIIRGVNKDLDIEALRLIKSMPNWVGGKHRGEPVKVVMTVGSW